MIKLFNPHFKLRSLVSQPVILGNNRGRRREPKPPTFEPPSHKSKHYTSLGQQPFSVRFGFRARRSDRSSIGYVTFTFFVSNRKYGPYLTDIRTTTKAFEGRRGLRISEQSFIVQKGVLAFLGRLEDSWASYDQHGEDITGEMVLAKSGLRVIKGEGGLHYAI